jgi:glycosyltransferase involved in cell wall biosynthesis
MSVDRRPLLLYVTGTEGMGGAEGYLRTLLLHTDQRRYRLALALPPRLATQPLVDLARASGVEIHYLDHVHREGLDPRVVARSVALLRRLRPALVHFVLAAPRHCAELVLAARLMGVQRRLVTFQLVTPVPRFSWLAARLRMVNRQFQYRTLHWGIAVSAGNRRLLVEQYGFPAQRLALIPNAVDTDYFRPRTDDGILRAQWGIPRDAPLIGLVGRLSPQKGHTVLFDALPAVWAAFPDAHVVLAGAGELEEALRAQAARIDPGGRIHFAGQQHDMPRALASLDVFVLPSLYEGLSFAVLEAMSTARAIVATAVDGTVEVIEDEHTGLLAPPGASEPLAKAITRLLGDSILRERLGQAARQTVVDRFDQRRMLDRTFALYE